MVGLERGVVELEPHDPAWERHYREEVERLRAIAGDRLLDFEHVGSTAIPGIPAKPIVDLLAVVADLEAARNLVPVLEANGYEHRPDTSVPDRLFFARGPRSNRTHYLSLTERDSECYREQVAFRDHLRENPNVAAEYARLKRDLAAAHADDRDEYTARKAGFIRRVLDDAMDGRNPDDG